MGYIYIHTNKLNGKKYIGQTIRKPKYRWSDGNGYKSNEHFYSSIQKYGWDNFEHEIRRCPDCLLDTMERNLIKYYDTMNPKKGYNHESGGNKFKYVSEDTRRKQSRSGKGKHHYNHTEEVRRKISEARKGIQFSEDHKKHLSEAAKKREVYPIQDPAVRQKANESIRVTQKKKSQMYKDYRQNGGSLLWKEWLSATKKGGEAHALTRLV